MTARLSKDERAPETRSASTGRPGLRRAIVRAPKPPVFEELRVPGRDGFVLETERTRLTAATVRDTADFFAAVESSRETLLPWLPWVPFVCNSAGAFRYLDACEQDWDESRACRFAIRERATDRFLGIVSLEHLVHAHRSGDFGYWIRDDATGRGFLHECAREVLDWSFHELGAERIRVAAATTNARSLRAIQKLGFRYEGTARRAEQCDGVWHDHAVFSLLSRDMTVARESCA